MIAASLAIGGAGGALVTLAVEGPLCNYSDLEDTAVVNASHGWLCHDRGKTIDECAADVHKLYEMMRPK